VLVTNSSPLNQYVARHPEYLFDTSAEAALINRDNLAIRVSHMKAAASLLGNEDHDAWTSRNREATPDQLFFTLMDQRPRPHYGMSYHLDA